MSVTESFLSRLSQKIKAFYLDQQGVYGVMTALLLLPLIILVAFTVETTGILLDKTRLSQATDQAALLLTAENNEFRAKKDHSDLMRQNLTAQEKALPADKQFSTRVTKRNQELVQDTVKLYLRSYGEGANAPITITKDFTAFCEPLSQSGKGEDGVTCTVQGDVRRRNGFGVIDEWVKSPDGRLPVNSGASYAVKKNSGVPMEVMLVADFSGSMDQDLNNNNAPLPAGVQSKIEVLREVVDEVTQVLLDNKNGANRVGFTLFSAAARQLNDKRCQMPILSTKEKSQEVITQDVYFNNYYAKEKNDFLKDASKRYGVKEGYFFDCKDEPKTFVDPRAEKDAGTRPIFDYTCKIKDTRENVIKILGTEMYGNNLQVPSTRIYPLTDLFRKYTDAEKTINQIDSLDGTFKSYPLTFDIPNSRLEYICPKKEKEKASLTTQAWFEGKNGQKDLVKEFNAMNPKNQTSASSGMIIATNAILAEDKAYRDKLDKLGKNPKRVMVVVSDGIDNFPYFGSFAAFQNNGMCEKIKKKIDSLQNPKYEKQDTRIGFIAISYDPKKATAGSTTNDNMQNYDAWKKCVDDYYYVVKNKQQLLDAFNEILGLQEELGTSSSQKIKRK